MKLRRASILVPLLLAAICVPAASADSARVTHGDAQAIFQAIGGFGAVLLHSPTLAGAPDDRSLGRIGVLGPADGRHYCSLDWHFAGAMIGEPGPYSAAAAELNQLLVTATLDGSELPLSTTAIKRWDPQLSLIQFGLAETYFRGEGEILSPDALSVGTHTASMTISDPMTGEVIAGAVTFYVDAPGTGACV